MARTKYTLKKSRTKLSPANLTISKKKDRPNIPINLGTMTSAELLDVFTAISAIEKGVSHSPTSSAKVSFMTRRYRHSRAATRNQMKHTISREIVERNKIENPATPEMIAKIEEIFG